MKRSRYGILGKNKNVIPLDDSRILISLYESEEGVKERIVAKTEVPDGEVSTVFLGINHGYGEKDLWFESMFFATVLDHPLDNDCERYETYQEALAGHEAMVRKVSEVKKCIKTK